MTKSYMDVIKEKLNNSKCTVIKDRPLTKDDLLNLDNYEFISISNSKGFNILTRRNYYIKNMINIPVLRFSDKNEYIIKGDIGKKDGLAMTAEDCAEYINELLDYNSTN